MLTIYHPPGCIDERRYIFGVIMGEFLGLEFQTRLEERSDIRICADMGSEEVVVSDQFFPRAEKSWLQPESLPQQRLNIGRFNGEEGRALWEPTIPVIFGQQLENGSYVKADGKKITIGVDIFGSAFFMLAGYEELVKLDRDNHQRFPAVAALAYQESFIRRPIINEYVEVLWWALKSFWPRLSRKDRTFAGILSHDIDYMERWKNTGRLLSACAGDALIRKDFPSAFRDVKKYMAVKLGSGRDDWDTFNFLIKISEDAGLRAEFNFMAAKPSKFDDGYNVGSRKVRDIIDAIHKSGHTIGFHPSFFSFDNENLWHNEWETINRVSPVAVKTGRQHYLRFDHRKTWRIWEAHGMEYDSTLYFADTPGFRSGVCFDYRVYDLVARKPLNLKERPMIFMDTSYVAYRKSEPEEMLSDAQDLIRKVKKFNGNFVMLWHNSSFNSAVWDPYQAVFQQMITLFNSG